MIIIQPTYLSIRSSTTTVLLCGFRRSLASQGSSHALLDEYSKPSVHGIHNQIQMKLKHDYEVWQGGTYICEEVGVQLRD